MEEKEKFDKLKQFNQKYKEMDALYHGVALKLGISDSMFWILYAISEADGDVTQYELYNDWFYSKQTINSSILNLVKEGYILKHDTGESRKRILLKLTQKGQEFIDKKINYVKSCELEAYNDLTEKEQKEFLLLIEKYLNFFRDKIKNL